VAMNF